MTDSIPQPVWLVKWLNSSKNEAKLEDEIEIKKEELPFKRTRIQMDVTYPPGTFCVKSRKKRKTIDEETKKINFKKQKLLEEKFNLSKYLRKHALTV